MGGTAYTTGYSLSVAVQAMNTEPHPQYIYLKRLLCPHSAHEASRRRRKQTDRPEQTNTALTVS